MGKASSYAVNNDQKAPATNGELATEEKPEAGKFRTLLPQILASTAKNFLLLDLGLSVAFPTIVIPALRRTVVNPNYEEPLYFTDVQASWFGSIAFVCQPIGSILSGLLTEPLGRKKAMIIVNIPHIIAWIILHYANSIEAMFAGAVLLGLGVGFMEAPIITYVGEICQPSIRGIIIACSGVAVTLGFFIVYTLGTVMNWRTAAAVCLAVPLSTVIAICFVPETPMWLLSKNRKDDALKSLQWLRGWVSPKGVEKEFTEMQRYSENSNKCTSCQKSNIKCEHPPPTMKEKLQELIRKRTLKAFAVVMGLFAFSQFSGIPSMRPFMVQIFKAYRIPLDPSMVTVVIGVVGLVANITCMCTIKLIGKRKICLIGFGGSVICCIALASYAETVFPKDYNSFDLKNHELVEPSYFPMAVFMVLAFWAYGGVTSTPWILLSEVFPFKSRGLSTGITAALNYTLGFVTTKTYLNVDKGLSLNGAMWFYLSVNILGFLFVYFLIPETENRTLEDIELHFSDNKRKLTDIKIRKNESQNNGIESGLPDNTVVNGISKKPSSEVRIAVIGAKENGVTEQSEVMANGCDNKGFQGN